MCCALHLLFLLVLTSPRGVCYNPHFPKEQTRLRAAQRLPKLTRLDPYSWGGGKGCSKTVSPSRFVLQG